MNAKEEPKRPPVGESPLRRIARRLANPRGTRRVLFAVACLVTLVAGYYLVVKWQGSRAWGDYREQAARRGVSLDFMTFVPPRVADEQNFAMTPFLAPLFDFKLGTQEWRDTNGYQRIAKFGSEIDRVRRDLGWRLSQRTDLATVGARWSSRASDDSGSQPSLNMRDAAQRILGLCTPFEPVFEELRQARQRTHARFNIRYDHEPPFQILLPHLSLVRRLCQALELRASASLALGQPDTAFRDLDLLLFLAEAPRGEPMIISHLVREACLQLGVQVVWEGLADQRWDAAQLEGIQDRLRPIDLLPEARRCLQAERAMGNWMIELVGRNPAWLHESGDGFGPRELLAVIPRGWLYFEQLNYNRAFDEYVLPTVDPAARRVDPARAKANVSALDRLLRDRALLNHRVACGVLLPSLGNVARKVAHGQSSMDLAVLGCALERHRRDHGRYPQSLGELVPKYAPSIPADVIDGRPLRYRFEDAGGFTLYSVGWNEVDDVGKVAFGKRQTWDIEQGDWVWRYPAAAGGVLPSTIAR